MRLVRLELIGEYKSIRGACNKPFVYQWAQSDEDYSPFCLVGLNGSGKSNFIELIADIFCYADRYSNPQYNYVPDLTYEFLIEYDIKRENEKTRVRLRGQNSALEMVLLSEAGEKRQNVIHRDFLPANVIAYSSGHNQGLSSVFAKTQFQFYEVIRIQGAFYREFWKRYNSLSGSEDIDNSPGMEDFRSYVVRSYNSNPALYSALQFYEYGQDESSIDLDEPLQPSKPILPKCIFIDHSFSQLVFIYLMITRNDRFISFVSDRLAIRDLCSFEIDIRLTDYRDYEMVSDISSRLKQLSADSLGKDATESSNKISKGILSGTLEFKINDAFFSSFERNYLVPEIFFEHLLAIHYLSAKKWSADEKKSLKTSGYIRNVPNVSGGLAPFRIFNTKLKLSNPEVETLYDRLSDGEHQLIQAIGSLIMFDKQESLFIMDEPESHFNPQWRMEFIDLIGKYVNLKNMDVMISTHSPFILSACKSERILSFTKSSGDVVINSIDVKTYGASFDSLLASIFDLDVLISEKPLEEIKEILKEYDRKNISASEALKRLNTFGDSFELNYRRNKLKNETSNADKGES